jgi:hypothetical protein
MNKNPNFFSNISELFARAVSLILVLTFFSIFFLARGGDFRMPYIQGFGILISGSIILYELLAFIFFEIFILVEHFFWRRMVRDGSATEVIQTYTKPEDMQAISPDKTTEMESK